MVFSNSICKEIFQKAYENRYVWPEKFDGIKGKCIFESNNKLVEGDFSLGNDFKTEINNISEDSIIKSISSQLFEVSIHRVKREFNITHSKNSFEFIRESEKGVEILVRGKNEGDKYRILDNSINMVYRKIHGVIIEIFVNKFLDTGNGLLSTAYTSQQLNPVNLDKQSQKLTYIDTFVNIKNKLWFLETRTIKYLNNNFEEIQKFSFEGLVPLD